MSSCAFVGAANRYTARDSKMADNTSNDDGITQTVDKKETKEVSFSEQDQFYDDGTRTYFW